MSTQDTKLRYADIEIVPGLLRPRAEWPTSWRPPLRGQCCFKIDYGLVNGEMLTFDFDPRGG